MSSDKAIEVVKSEHIVRLPPFCMIITSDVIVTASGFLDRKKKTKKNKRKKPLCEQLAFIKKIVKRSKARYTHTETRVLQRAIQGFRGLGSWLGILTSARM